MRILLIEPDLLQANIYRQILAAAGHTVDYVRSAQSAVHIADGHRPDLVLLELELPNHNGVEFLYEFRSYPEWLDIPVIIHSFVPPAELIHVQTLGNELGVVRCLYKPETTLVGLCSAVQSVALAQV